MPLFLFSLSRAFAQTTLHFSYNLNVHTSLLHRKHLLLTHTSTYTYYNTELHVDLTTPDSQF